MSNNQNKTNLEGINNTNNNGGTNSSNLAIQNPSIKILVGYHKPAVLLKNEIFTPIHLGRALATETSKDGEISKEDFEWMCDNMIGDDTGDNISYLNRYFCELTGIYWAWKNYDKLGNPDYIGFMHYRRIFDFECENREEYDPIWNHQFLNSSSNQDIAKIKSSVIKNKIIGFSCNTNPYQHFQSVEYLHIEDYEKCLELINRKFPKYSLASKQYNEGNISYFCNMFVFPKKEFFEYCEFIFGVLFEMQNEIDTKFYSVIEMRIFGYLSEWLTGIFFTKIKNNTFVCSLPIKILNDFYSKDIQINPAFKENNIPIVFSCDDNYFPYAMVAIHSLIQNSNKNYNYDICILYHTIDKTYIERARVYQSLNVSIRFVCVTQKLKNIMDLFFTPDYLTLSAYFRLFIPSVFSKYKKIIYIDTDTIILNDVAALFKTSLDNKALGAVRDIGMAYFIKNIPDFFLSRFITQKLKLQNHYNYFNTGILVYNIKKCLEINFEKRCLDKLLELKNPPTADQDILNAALENEIHFISPSWNCMQNHTGIDNQQYINSIPNVHMHDYIASQKDPYIIHYIGSSKPWNSPHLPKADIWWCYARQTPFYEEILFKNIKYFTFKNLPSNHINSIYVKPCGAVEKIKSHLSYKLGNEILSVKENKIKMFILPFTLFFIFIKHKFSILILNLISDVNPNLKPLNLEEYQDYQQALQVKNYLSYRLGNALVKHPFAFIFRANKVYKDWKREKGRG
ncbi:DUF4422 domain-containing protein [Campylobacter coli]|uniref:DUF4422 domain-containing protein n=1 Tax=Campylobacter coli TaxID=195 RepID=UPI003B893507